MPQKIVLDKEKIFSKSLLWKLQDVAYSEFGPNAWSQKGVPFYVTSNPWTAKAYAKTVVGYLRDAKLEEKEPIYLFDLGAGSGRFGFLFLREFFKIIEKLPFSKYHFCYVMTDFAEANIDFWQKHPLFQPYLEREILDFCVYRHDETKEELTLLRSKKKISSKTVKKNPLILLANYFFDTIPQDLFRISDGKVEEGLISLSIKGKKAKTLKPELIPDLVATYSYRPLQSKYCATVSKLLETYKKSHENLSFLLPTGAFQVIDYFQKLSNNNLLLLAGDQGVVTEEQEKEMREPRIAIHGSFSVAVSYRALSHYFALKKGISFQTAMPKTSFVVMGGIFPEKAYPETRLAFKENLDAFEPCDYWQLSLAVEKNATELEELLLLVKLGNFDPMNFYAFFEMIRQKIPGLNEALKTQLKAVIEQVYERFYPISEADGAFPLNLGVLYFDLKCYEKALEYFDKAEQILGETDTLRKNKGACYLLLHQRLL